MNILIGLSIFQTVHLDATHWSKAFYSGSIYWYHLRVVAVLLYPWSYPLISNLMPITQLSVFGIKKKAEIAAPLPTAIAHSIYLLV